MDFDIFDCHHHVGDVRAFMPLTGDDDAPTEGDALAAERAERVRIMDDGGVHQAAVIAGHAYPRTNGIADTRVVNDRMAAYRDAQPDRFPVAIGLVEPIFEAACLPELDRCANELGLAGISFHTRFQGVSMDSPWVARYVGHIGELGMVPVLHAMTESADEALWKTAEVATRVPRPRHAGARLVLVVRGHARGLFRSPSDARTCCSTRASRTTSTSSRCSRSSSAPNGWCSGRTSTRRRSVAASATSCPRSSSHRSPTTRNHSSLEATRRTLFGLT